MRVVLDTNVLVSALLTAGGPPDAIVRAAYNGDFQLVASSPLVAELRSVLIRPRIKERLGWSDQEIAAFITHFSEQAVRPIALIQWCWSTSNEGYESPNFYRVYRLGWNRLTTGGALRIFRLAALLQGMR